MVPTILLVQPDSSLRSSWSDALEADGHSVLAEENVIDAVARAREGGIDAVVLDAADPGASARVLIDRLHRLPEPPPLILVSSSSQAPELSARIGAAAFVPNPCTGAELARAVGGVVNSYVRSAIDDEDTRRNKFDW